MQEILFKVTIMVKVRTEQDENQALQDLSTECNYDFPSVPGVEVLNTEWRDTEVVKVEKVPAQPYARVRKEIREESDIMTDEMCMLDNDERYEYRLVGDKMQIKWYDGTWQNVEKCDFEFGEY